LLAADLGRTQRRRSVAVRHNLEPQQPIEIKIHYRHDTSPQDQVEQVDIIRPSNK
jgi:hypothetical protein